MSTLLHSFPRINLFGDLNSYRMEIELPGLTASDIDLTVTKNELYIEGNNVNKKFLKTIRLPFEIDIENTEANIENEVLTILLPKNKTTEVYPNQAQNFDAYEYFLLYIKSCPEVKLEGKRVPIIFLPSKAKGEE